MSSQHSHVASATTQKPGIEELSMCIDLLLHSVYAASLYKLQQILECVKSEVVHIWATHRTGKIRPLIELVVKGLEHDVHALSILTILAEHTILRDCMVLVKPQILSGMLKASLINERSFEKFSSVVTALLGPPMPAEYLAPHLLTSFISTLEQAITSDSKQYLFSLASILRHNMDHYLPILSQNQIYSLTTTLANLLASEDTATVLGALSCLASISQATVGTGYKSVKNNKSLFLAEKGRKVLRLVLSTISSQFSNENETDTSTLKRDLDLITNILRAIDKQTFQDWYQTREGFNSLKRILEKLELQTDIEGIEAACTYVSAIFVNGDLPVSELQPLATRICARSIDRLQHCNHSSHMLHAFELMLPLSSIPDLDLNGLCNVVFNSTIMELEPSNWHECLQIAACVRMIDLLRCNADCRAYLAPVLLSQQYYELITRFTEGSSTTMSPRPHNLRRQKLDHSICRLVLSIQCDTNIPAASKQTCEIADLLLDKFSLMCSDLIEPHVNLKKQDDTVSLQETINTPHSGSSSHAWRAQLLDELQTEAQYKHQSIIAKVDLICRDFERRAEINEEPLRECERELEQAREVINQLQSRLTEATAELQQRDLENQHVFEERTRFENVIANLIAEIEAGNKRITGMEELQSVKHVAMAAQKEQLRQAEEEIKRIRQLMENADQQNSARVAILTENLNSISEAKAALASQVADKVGELAVRCEEVAAAKLSKQQVEATAAFLQAQLAAQKNSHEEALEQNTRTVDALVEQRGRQEAELNEVEKLVEDLHTDLNHQSKVQADLRTQLEDTKLFADEQMSLMQEAQQSSLKTLEDELQLTKCRSDEAIKIALTENASLKALLSKVRSSYERRCQEFEKAQDLSKKLMAVMRGSSEDSTPHVNSPGGHNKFMYQTPAPANALTSKRTKDREPHPTRHIRRAMSADMTTDSDFDSPAGKENVVPAKTSRSSRKSFRNEDTMILSELSGLGL